MYDDTEDQEHEGEMEATENEDDYLDPDLGQDGILTDPDGTN